MNNVIWMVALTAQNFIGRFIALSLTALILSGLVSVHAKDLPGASQTSYSVGPSGAFSFQIPIVVPVGRNGMQPSLSLAFSSGGGNGSVGVGWGVSGLSSITRCGRTHATDGVGGGVGHNEDDRYCLNGKRLINLDDAVAYSSEDSEYRTEIDEISKVVSSGTTINSNGGIAPESFKVWRKDGMILSYGITSNSRFKIPGSSSIHAWKLQKAEDQNGNFYEITYEQIYRLPSSITYAGGHSVVFDYGDARQDVRSWYFQGEKITFDERLDKIEVKRGTTVLRSYNLAYQTGTALEKSKLDSVTECGREGIDCLPAIDIEWKTDVQGFDASTADEDVAPEALIEHFSYQKFVEQGQPTSAAIKEINRGVWADVNGDGRTDMVVAYETPGGQEELRTFIKTDTGWQKHELGGSHTMWQLPKTLRSYDSSVTNMSTARFKSEVINQGQLIDVDGDGLVDVVYAFKLDRGVKQYKGAYGTPSETIIEDVKITYLNTGSGWQESTTYKPKDYLFDYFATSTVFGNAGRATERGRFIDIDGDGLVDWITAIYFKHEPWASRQQTYINNGSGWTLDGDYAPPSYLNEYYGIHSWGRGELVDVNGDGLLDWIESYKNKWDNAYGLIANTWINDGTKFVQDNAYNLPEEIYHNNGHTYSAVKRGLFIDINGDGLSDFVRSYKWGSTNIQQATLINKGRKIGSSAWTNDAIYKPPFVESDYTFIGHTGQSGDDRGPGWGVRIHGYYQDVNRDGLVDFVQSYRDTQNPPVTHRDTWVNDGEKFVPQNGLNMNGVLMFDYEGRGQSTARSGSFVDINSDGSPDWVNAHTSSMITKTNRLARANQISEITTTAGIKIKPTFKPLTDNNSLYQKGTGSPEANSRHTAGQMYVTSGLSVTNPIGGDNTTRYRYGGAQVHMRGRGFLGFKTFTIENMATALTQVSEYRQDYPYIGFTKTSILRESSVTDDNIWLSKTTKDYATKSLNGGKTQYPYLSSNTTQTRELSSNGAEEFSWAESSQTVDGYGNVLTNSSQNGPSAGSILLTSDVVNVYKLPIESSWLVGRLSTTTSTHVEPDDSSNQKTRETEYKYHDGTSKGWLIQSVIREPDSNDASIKLTTSYDYDAYGNVTKETITSPDVTDPYSIRTNEIDYDLDHRLPTSLTNALDHTSSLAYDDYCDSPDTVTDANFLETKYQYDNFCRQKSVENPTGIYVLTSYDFSPTCTECEYSVQSKRQRDLVNIESPVTVFYNRFSQPVLSRTTGFLVTQTIENRTQYDDLGRVIEQSQPRFKTDAEYVTKRAYDLLNRTTLTTLPYPGRGLSGKAIIEYEYTVETGRQKRTTRDTLNNAKTVFANALGQIVEIRDAKTGFLTYNYDAHSNLVQTQAMGDAATNITIGYDKLGRREQLIDPDLGTSNYTYYAFGQVRTQTDAKGNMLKMKYDKLGRLKEREVPRSLNSTHKEVSVWTYDEDLSIDVSGSAVGRIARIQRRILDQQDLPININQDNLDHRKFVYDGLGRPAGKVSYIKGERFDEAYTYNNNGYLDSRAYPSSGSKPVLDASGNPVLDAHGNPVQESQNFKVAYTYSNGYLTEISGLDEFGNKCITHWKVDEYDALGRTKIDTLGQLVKTTRTYNPAQGVLERIKSELLLGDGVVSHAGESVQDLNYVYEDNNNLSSRNDAITGVDETFDYDELNRLEFHHRTDASSNLETTEVRYDPLGNITYKSDAGYYEYNSSRPHAVTKVTAIAYDDLIQNSIQTSSPLSKFEVDWEWNGQSITNSQPNIHNTTYQYDANGNIEEQGDRYFSWTAFDKPSGMIRAKSGGGYTGSEIGYNADFNRNYKEEGTFTVLGAMDNNEPIESTFYIGKEYEKIVDDNGVRHRYTISTGGGTIQIEREDGTAKDKPMYMLGDYLGSINLILNGLGAVEQRLEFDPWGMRIAGPQVGVVNSITNKGYTGHEMDDEVGLINMNARIYDPLLGRFLSPDSVLPDPYNLQSFNRYSYVRNNPLKYTDPTGNLEEIVVTAPHIDGSGRGNDGSGPIGNGRGGPAGRGPGGSGGGNAGGSGWPTPGDSSTSEGDKDSEQEELDAERERLQEEAANLAKLKKLAEERATGSRIKDKQREAAQDKYDSGRVKFNIAAGNLNQSIFELAVSILVSAASAQEGGVEVKFGDGYTGRIDKFNYKGEASHEIHVFDKKGREVGVHGPRGWINKHGLKGAPTGLPSGVQNQVKGATINELRMSGRFPTKGSVNIKGNNWKFFVKFGGAAAVVGNINSQISVVRACGINPKHDGC